MILAIIIIRRHRALRAYCDTCYCYSGTVCPFLCPSVTLLHPAKAVGWNETPFGRHTCAVPSNVVLHTHHDPPRKGGTPSLQRYPLSPNYFGHCCCCCCCCCYYYYYKKEYLSDFDAGGRRGTSGNWN